ncbi:MAG: hypothetical protein ACJ8AT_32120 [Hyalangium sp.]|uniref:hypothetical protein n=1 Tax=Hyalangium sp. TaxID=2028555 RepID=UPI00389AA987
MNSRLLFAFLCIASLSTGCIINDNGGCSSCRPPPAQRGDVTFLWTFGNLRCDQARDVYGVNITIPGEQLLNNGNYACSTNGVDGITLHDFAPGSYPYTLQAVDFNGRILFEANGTFIIDGSRTVMVDLAPSGSPGSSANLNWNFPGNASCSTAGVYSVDVTVDDKTANFPCTQGQTAQGVATDYIAPGEHYIEFVALDAQRHPLYYYNGGLTTQAYTSVNASYNLYTIGGASISWRMSDYADGSVTFDCPQSNPTVYVNFQDRNTGNWVYPAAGDGHACSTKPIVFQFLKPGSYTLRVSTTISGYNYVSAAGIIVNVGSHAITNVPDVTLYRQ